MGVGIKIIPIKQKLGPTIIVFNELIFFMSV